MTERHWWCEFKVRVLIRHETQERAVNDSMLSEMESDWLHDREEAINLASKLDRQGCKVEIRTREQGSFAAKDFGEIPE